MWGILKMNDFTKEELYDLQSWGDAYTSYDADSDIYKMHEPLLTKIQSMIDNYCENEKKLIFPKDIINMYQMLLRYCDGHDIRTEINESLEDRMSNETTEALSATSRPRVLASPKKE
jgi:hypothetical protein